MALDLSATAKKLIRSLAGKSEDLLFYRVRKTDAVIDANTGAITTPATVKKTEMDGALTNFSQSLVNGQNVLTGDLKLICSADFDYLVGDYVEVYGRNYAIVNPKQINHAGVVQCWILQLRPM